MKEINNVKIYKWSHEAPNGIEISKDDVEVPEEAEIYVDFRDKAEERMGKVLRFEKDEEFLKTDIEIDEDRATDEELRQYTLAPAFEGEMEEGNDGETKILKGVTIANLGLITGEHEDRDLTKNLDEAMNDD